MADMQITAEQPLPAPTARERPEAIKAIPMRHPWRWVAALAILGFFALALYIVATAPGADWSIVWKFLFHGRIVQGVLTTIELTVIEGTGTYRRFVGGHNHMVDRLHFLAPGDGSGGFEEYCICYVSRP